MKVFKDIKILDIRYLIFFGFVFSFLFVGQVSLVKAEENQSQFDSGAFESLRQRTVEIGKHLDSTSSKPLEETLGGVIKGALILVGTVFLILMVYGGYIWMLARGDEQEAKKARDIINMAITGLIVVLAAYVITYFILYRLTQATGTM